MPKKGEFPTKFFGYNKKQVEAALQEKEALTALKAEVIQELIQQKKNHLEELKKELNELEDQVAAKAQQKELLDFARFRAKEAVLLLEKEADKQIERLMDEAKLKKENEQRQITDIENEIKQAKDYIETLLDSVVSVLTNTSTNSIEEALPHKVVAKITPGKVFPGKNIQNQSQDKEAAVRGKDEAAAEEIREERMTADGAVAPSFDKQYNQFMANISQAMTASKNLELAATNEKKETLKKESSFWEEDEAPEPGEPKPQADPPEEGQKNSPVLSKEINDIRYKYIVGKIAGEDLVDAKGLLIIGKGLPITDKHVNLAEGEGKLAELILNMKLSGLEE